MYLLCQTTSRPAFVEVSFTTSLNLETAGRISHQHLLTLEEHQRHHLTPAHWRVLLLLYTARGSESTFRRSKDLFSLQTPHTCMARAFSHRRLANYLALQNDYLWTCQTRMDHHRLRPRVRLRMTKNQKHRSLCHPSQLRPLHHRHHHRHLYHPRRLKDRHRQRLIFHLSILCPSI